MTQPGPGAACHLSTADGSKRPARSLGDVIEQFGHVDDPDAYERSQTIPALAAAMDWLRPRNWHASGLSPDDILPVAVDCGIPVVWVPPTAVLIEVTAAHPSDRLGVLVSRQDEVLAHCEALLTQCRDPELQESRTLAGRAMEALRAGHHEAGMALAVVVAEKLAFWVSEIRTILFDSCNGSDTHDAQLGKRNNLRYRYGLPKELLDQMDSDERKSRFDVMRRALLAPIPKFFTKFHPDDGDPVPETVSRHATVHRPTVEHLSPANALLSVMLCTSYLREQQQWIEDNGHE